MCGVAGFWRFDGAVDYREIAGMAASMAHRGPDSWGYAYFDTRVPGRDLVVHDTESGPDDHDLTLGHRRLAIIDLSSLGNQPMTFGSLTIAYNGEVYNYIELADELKGFGHRFVSRSDTEVILHAWAAWGTGCVSRLNGIFAFLLWDASARKLFAVRDRLGVKPLYYYQDGQQIALASEIRAILSVLDLAPAVDEELVFDFLATGRLDHHDDTMFRGIRRLPGGCWMEVSRTGTEIRRYWTVPVVGQPDEELTFEAAAGRFSELFADAVRLQMRSDVPVGACLSGGLDSSSLVSVASRLSATPMSTFTARFGDRAMDEWEWAQTVHRTSRVAPFSAVADPGAFLADLPPLILAQEEPIAGPGVYAQWRVMQLVKEQGIRVVLDGQGGDELLCGYAKYVYWAIGDLVRSGNIPAALASVADVLLRGGSFLFELGAARRYLPWGIGVEAQVHQLIQPAFASRHAVRDAIRPTGSIAAHQVADVETFSLPILLRYEDKNSMAHSVESRVPFLDHRLVEFCLALPTSYKVKGGLSKLVLREGLKGVVPDTILKRRSKLGFGGSYASWVKQLRPQLTSWASVEDRPVFRYVVPSGVRSLIRRSDPAVFRVLALATWLETFGLTP